MAALDTVYDFNAVDLRQQRSGYVYLLVNPAMPGILKIGRTTRLPAKRVVELSGATGVPVPFELLFETPVLDARAAERYIHDRLDALGARLAENCEFFKASPSVAVNLLLEARQVIGAAEPLGPGDGV